MKKKQVIIIVISAIVVIGAFIGITVIKSYINNYSTLISEISITNVDLSKVSNGTYTGSYKAFPVTAEVKVTVNGQRITEIDLIKHDNGKGTAAEIMPDKVVEAQTLNVDIVTGATASSKVILKAIENALNNGLK